MANVRGRNGQRAGKRRSGRLVSEEDQDRPKGRPGPVGEGQEVLNCGRRLNDAAGVLVGRADHPVCHGAHDPALNGREEVAPRVAGVGREAVTATRGVWVIRQVGWIASVALVVVTLLIIAAPM